MPIFSVYVVELNKSICHRTACPSRDSGKPHVYVGETEQTPRSGSKSTWRADSPLLARCSSTASASSLGSIGTGGHT